MLQIVLYVGCEYLYFTGCHSLLTYVVVATQHLVVKNLSCFKVSVILLCRGRRITIPKELLPLDLTLTTVFHMTEPPDLDLEFCVYCINVLDIWVSEKLSEFVSCREGLRKMFHRFYRTPICTILRVYIIS